MQASTRVLCTEEVSYQLFRTPSSETSSSTQLEGSTGDSRIQQSTSANAEETEEKPAKPIGTNDPLKWFGILIPPALRVSQAAFQNAITMVPKLAALDVEMRALEIEIRRTRKKVKRLEG